MAKTDEVGAFVFQAQKQWVERTLLLDSAVRSVYAHMAEAPTNWHQATVFLLSSDDPAERAMAPTMLASGYVMVLFQWATAVGAIGSTTFPSCQSTDQCGRGTYCNIGGNNRCNTCGDRTKFLDAYDPAVAEMWAVKMPFRKQMVALWMAACPYALTET